MTIKLRKNNKIEVFLNKKAIDDTYLLTFRNLSTNDLIDFVVYDETPTERFATFNFVFDDLKSGSYEYTLINDFVIYKKGIAFHKHISTPITEHNSSKKYNTFYDK